MPNKERPDKQTPGDLETPLLHPVDPIPTPDSCPIGWQPNALAPVFHGVRDLGPTDGAPVPLRIFFPSLDGNPWGAAMLKGCGRYPLILFAHGHCHPDPANYTKWYLLPAQLARAGYVVVVPQLANIGSHPSGNEIDLNTLGTVREWMRATWEHRDALLPAPATGIVGHSYGAVLAARFTNAGGIAAYASLSGVHTNWSGNDFPFKSLTVPKLFIMGVAGVDLSDVTLSDNLWNPLSSPKHRAVFPTVEHWDYVPSDTSLPCASGRGPCALIPAATADLVTMFFARYLPPELNPTLPNSVPETLVPPALVLTPEQQPYSGDYLVGFRQLEGAGQDCRFKLYPSLERVVPYVVSSPTNAARNDVLAADLVPEFTGPGSDYVQSQTPAGGTIVNVGSTVKMYLVDGEVP
jgi:dienelactone hydrolase